jgi:RNA recognition motif-containing protein
MDPKSGSSKGFGFIEMPNTNEAKAAIKNLSYKTVGRNKIRVKTTKN